MKQKNKKRSQPYSKRKKSATTFFELLRSRCHLSVWREGVLLKARKTVVRTLLYALIFLLPTQFGKHFFFDFSYISGVRVDYLAPTIYLTDVLAFFLLVLNFPKIYKSFLDKKILILLLLLLINVIFAKSPVLAFYKFLKFFELLVIFFMVKEEKLEVKLILAAFLTSAVIELILSFWQLTIKHSIQGLFYFLGERYLTLATPGVAKTTIMGIEFLRPYGTFSHPNSMGGFYLLLYFFVLTQLKSDRHLILKNALLLVSSALILISFSKIAILTFLLLNIVYLLKNKFWQKCLFCFVSRIAVISILAFIFFQSQNDPLTIKKRLILIQNAFPLIRSHWLIGVGIGNYLVAVSAFKLPYLDILNQPVHNIILLIVAEMGIVIPLFLIVLFYRQLIDVCRKNIYLVLAFLLTGFFDHYWVTLEQNFMLLGVIFGLLQ